MLMAKRWRIRPFDSVRVADFARSASLPTVVAQLLIARGVECPQLATAFLQPRLSDLRPPELLPGIEAAAERILRAIKNGERITIYGDYDADGITATAILVRCLRLLLGDVDFYVPNRLDEGYGLNEAAIRHLSQRGTKLLVTVDCGITSCREALVASELGIDLIITDHHQSSAQLPEHALCVHPSLPGSEYPFPGLCGAGVAFKLAWQLCKLASGSPRVGDRFREYLFFAIAMASIGTVADVVPLIDENRLLVKHGLECLAEHGGIGIQALLAVTKLHQKPQLGSEDIAFSLAPRINAAGRLGQAEIALELLLTDSAERARDLANYLHELNQTRDSVERSIYLAALKLLPPSDQIEKSNGFVLGQRGWHSGVIGIVAGRIAEKFGRPCVLISFDPVTDEPGVGSGRSALGINLHQVLDSCREHLVTFGGHAAAAGLRIRHEHLPSFQEAFNREVGRAFPSEDRIGELQIDAEAPLPQLTLRTVDQIERLAPFGQANPRPILCASEVQLLGPPKFLGQGDRHLSVQLSQHSVSLRAVAFGQGEWAQPLKDHSGPIDVAYRPVVNEFGGRRTVELRLVDWRPSKAR
jgi:single-stranded-DNA-specific exonuclease